MCRFVLSAVMKNPLGVIQNFSCFSQIVLVVFQSFPREEKIHEEKLEKCRKHRKHAKKMKKQKREERQVRISCIFYGSPVKVDGDVPLPKQAKQAENYGNSIGYFSSKKPSFLIISVLRQSLLCRMKTATSEYRFSLIQL